MRKAEIRFKDEAAGVLIQEDDGSFAFQYDDAWMADGRKPAISPTLPKSEGGHRSEFLFPFFYNMLPEGSNKEAVCKIHSIDPSDSFGLLMAAARHDSIGAVRVIPKN